MQVLKVDIKTVKKKYPRSEYPMLEYCKYLINTGEDPKIRLEAWNYERKVPEADWTVNDIGEYVKNEKYIKNLRIRGPWFFKE